MARPAGKKLNSAALRAVLRYKGWSLTTLSEHTGISLATLSGLTRGYHFASDPVLRQLCEALEVEDGVLFPSVAGWEDPPRPPKRKLAEAAA